MNHKRFSTTLALLIVALCASSLHAQSGRRQTKPAPAAPVPTPTPEPTPIPKEEVNETELAFFVGSDIHSAHGTIPLSYHSAAQRGCADRLRSKSSAVVDAPQRDMNRGEAIEKAKSSTNTYVVLLTLVYDTMARSADEIQLDFLVLAPGTAKVVLTGRSYLNSLRKGPIVVGPGRAGLYREAWIRQAGEDAADRILKKLNVASTKPK